MNVLIELVYVGWENKIMRKGNFPINKKKFEENNNLAVAEVAFKWVRKIMCEENISRIITVKYNGGHDITDIVEGKLGGNSEDNMWF